MALTGCGDGPGQAHVLQVLQLGVGASRRHGEEADLRVASGLGELPAGVGNLGDPAGCDGIRQDRATATPGALTCSTVMAMLLWPLQSHTSPKWMSRSVTFSEPPAAVRA